MTKILIVDDEEEIVQMLRRRLELEGFEIDGAYTCEGAVEKMKNELYPIVVLDIRFPETTGQRILSELKSVHPLVNVVIITGYSSMHNVVECMEKGAVDYFTKPLDMDVFVQTIERLEEKVDRWKLGMSVQSES